jgi:hypothetical protein
VIGVDLIDEMLSICRVNLGLAEKENSWFRSEFVDLRKGDALALPLKDGSVDVAAQNCLFNIFRECDLTRALVEMYRVLRPHGRLVLSDPVCEQAMPAALRNDDRLRAMCLSGAIPLNDYLAQLTDIGFGTIEVRARRPYRVLATGKYATSERIYIESVEVCAIKDLVPVDGPASSPAGRLSISATRTISTTARAMSCSRTSLSPFVTRRRVPFRRSAGTICSYLGLPGSMTAAAAANPYAGCSQQSPILTAERPSTAT